MAEWFANMNIALYRIDTAGKTTKTSSIRGAEEKSDPIKHVNTSTKHCGNFLDKLYSVSRPIVWKYSCYIHA